MVYSVIILYPVSIFYTEYFFHTVIKRHLFHQGNDGYAEYLGHTIDVGNHFTFIGFIFMGLTFFSSRFCPWNYFYRVIISYYSKLGSKRG
jgi:hypothetical protein